MVDFGLSLLIGLMLAVLLAIVTALIVTLIGAAVPHPPQSGLAALRVNRASRRLFRSVGAFHSLWSVGSRHSRSAASSPRLNFHRLRYATRRKAIECYNRRNRVA
jgi:hypothetical protein